MDGVILGAAGAFVAESISLYLKLGATKRVKLVIVALSPIWLVCGAIVGVVVLQVVYNPEIHTSSNLIPYQFCFFAGVSWKTVIHGPKALLIIKKGIDAYNAEQSNINDAQEEIVNENMQDDNPEENVVVEEGEDQK